MNEITKTLTFVGVALAIVAVAWVSQPSSLSMKPEEMQGKLLFDKLTDPQAVTSLEILKYDEATATMTPFKVAQINGRWSIPSHDNYPADAKDHLATAANSLMDLKVLSVESTSPGDHELYGVVDPGSKSLAAGATGVGMHVTMKDKDDKALLDLIIGKQDKDRPDIHFVRRAGEDPVYAVTLKTDKLSTKFEDWIEKDLLKMNAWDIMGIKVQDYSIDLMARAQNYRGQFSLAYNDTGDPKWKMSEDRVLEEGKWADAKMADDEELDAAKLDAMRTALDDLKIVDISRKPQGLSGDLKATGSVYADEATAKSLMTKGFYLVPAKGDSYELLSNEGETRVTMKDGVEYILRFGQIAGNGAQAEEKKEGEKKDDAAGGLNRYLFVMAEFNPDSIKKPELQPLPEVPAEEPKAEAKDGEKKEGDKKEAAKPDPKAERDRIEKENKRKQDEYDQKVQKGQERVKELNERFADWYYIISDGVYKKIHLSRADIVKKKGANEAKPGAPGAAAPVDTSATPAALEELKNAVPAPAEPPAMEAPAAEAPKADEPKPEQAKPEEP
jgi:hypothetical protein